MPDLLRRVLSLQRDSSDSGRQFCAEHPQLARCRPPDYRKWSVAVAVALPMAFVLLLAVGGVLVWRRRQDRGYSNKIDEEMAKRMKQTKQKRKPASRTVSSSINQVQRPGPSVIQPKAVRGTAPATRQVPPPQVAPTQPVTQVSRTSLSTTPESSVSIMPANAALHTQPSTAEVVPVPPRPALPAEPVLPSDHQEPTVVVPEIPAQSSPEEKNEVSQTSAQPKEEAAWQQSEAQATYLDSETEHKPDRPVSHTPTPTSKAEVDLERSSM